MICINLSPKAVSEAPFGASFSPDLCCGYFPCVVQLYSWDFFHFSTTYQARAETLVCGSFMSPEMLCWVQVYILALSLLHHYCFPQATRLIRRHSGLECLCSLWLSWLLIQMGWQITLTNVQRLLVYLSAPVPFTWCKMLCFLPPSFFVSHLKMESCSVLDKSQHILCKIKPSTWSVEP